MLAESPDTALHAGEPVRGNLPFAYPLEQRARLYLQVLGSLICGKPFCFHVSLFSHSGNAGSRRLRGRLCRVLSRKRTRFLRMVAAIISTDLARRCVENIAGITNRFPQGAPMLQIANQPSTARYKENRCHLHLSFLTALRPVSFGIAQALPQRLVSSPFPYWPLLLERVPLVAPGSSGRSKERGL